jgi:hypothetical protein
LAVAKLADVGNARYKVLRQDDGRDARGGRAESDSSGYGYIDKSGKMVIKPQFDRAGDFTDGLAEVRVTDRTPGSDILTEPPQPPPNYRDGYIDRTGNYVWRSPTQQVRDRSDRSRD